jgi:uncharacterized protein
MTLAIKHNHYPSFNPVDAIDLAAEKIAPSWPLDQSIAVNPWWKLRHMEMTETAAKLGFLGNIRMLMPKDYYQALWQTEISEAHLEEAKVYYGVYASTQALLDYLEKPETNKHWEHITDFLDDQPSHQYRISWREEVLQQVSNFCAFYLKFPEQFVQYANQEDGFYQAWRASTIADKGMQILTGEKHLRALFTALPENLSDLVEQNFYDLAGVDVDPQAWEDYLYALVLDINGWASWFAYEEWQADLYNKPHSQLLRQLVGIRMAWDWVLWQNTMKSDQQTFQALNVMFVRQLNNASNLQSQVAEENKYLWVWHKAVELKFQQTMHDKLMSVTSMSVQKPVLQAVFCIDVRSEQYRKQLEAQHHKIETYGFAGFFGLPIAYTSKAGNSIRPQLPGLLKPTLFVQQAVSKEKANQTQASLKNKVSWKLASDSAASTFGMVESQGLLKVFDLLKHTLFGAKPQRLIASEDSEIDWEILSENKALDIEALAALAKAILKGMGLKVPYAATVLIVGHGSFSTNNPHASGLDCGACGGQTGEVNAMVLCYLLNSLVIRMVLNNDGLNIPEQTKFVPCLHNTVTDEVMVLNDAIGDWENWLNGATVACQEQKFAAEGLSLPDAKSRQKALKQKSKDWAQLRPEWGLANNAAFVVAPRAFTRDVDFEGRSFLHDYQWQADEGFHLLEQIMTAPMIVTNWINLQYYASVTDNKHYGSGNKLLHNVVGGNFGVFEGNGGDLRIGLPQQSLHDGKKWRHNPVRLNVYIAAPKEAINDIIQKHAMVKALIENQWLFLFQWDQARKSISVYEYGDWKVAKAQAKQSINQIKDSKMCKQIALDGWQVQVTSKIVEVYGCKVEIQQYPCNVLSKAHSTKNLTVDLFSYNLSHKSKIASNHKTSNQAISKNRYIEIDGRKIEVSRKTIEINGVFLETDDSPMIINA